MRSASCTSSPGGCSPLRVACLGSLRDAGRTRCSRPLKSDEWRHVRRWTSTEAWFRGPPHSARSRQCSLCHEALAPGRIDGADLATRVDWEGHVTSSTSRASPAGRSGLTTRLCRAVHRPPGRTPPQAHPGRRDRATAMRSDRSGQALSVRLGSPALQRGGGDVRRGDPPAVGGEPERIDPEWTERIGTWVSGVAPSSSYD